MQLHAFSSPDLDFNLDLTWRCLHLSLEPCGVAQRAGCQVGDVILAIDDVELSQASLALATDLLCRSCGESLITVQSPIAAASSGIS